MDVTESTLKGILEGSKQYLVPLYQRPYAWQSSQWQKLWDDIIELVDYRRRDPKSSHFTGTLVLEAGEVTTEVTRFLVVDGQQRLTTLSVLIGALAKLYESNGDPGSAKRLREQVLVNPYVAGTNERFRLRPANFDEQVFREAIEGLNPFSDSSLIDNAFRYFTKQLTNVVQGDITFEELESAILNGLKFVTITAKADDNVYRIFESINNTGIDLTQADLIRNLIFSRLGDKAEEIHERIWKNIQKDLDSEDLENLFWIEAQWRNAEVRRLATFDFQKKLILDLDLESLVAYLENTLKIAHSLRKVRLLAKSNHDQLNYELAQLDQLKLPGALVLATRIIYLLETQKIDEQDAAEALRVLKGYLVRRFIGSVPVSNLQGICAAAAHDLFGDATREVHRILSTGRKKYLTDRQIRELFETVPIYDRSRKSRLSVVMSWLLASKQGKDTIDFDEMSIEHVLPQRPSEKAFREFASQVQDEEDPKEVHDRLVHTFGNLTLTNYNSELSNSAFSEKRASWLQNTAVIENQEIARQTAWGPKEILERSRKLAELAITLWPGPDESLLESEPETIGSRIDAVIGAIPRGNWTSYGDIAKLLGTAGQVVGMRASKEVPGSWRVLRASGEIAPGFKWAENSVHAGRDVKDVLIEEGLSFDDRGLALEEFRLRSEQLAELIGEI